MAVHFRAFQKITAAAHHQESRVVDEMVIDAVFLAGTRRARGVRDREFERRIGACERVDERGFARRRKAR